LTELTGQAVPAAEEILAGVEEALAVGRPRRDLRLTDTVRDGLRLDSLALLELLTRIEERFGVELVDRPELYTSLSTVGDLVTMIRDVLTSGQEQR
jgi:acyl carrier protein